MHVLTNKIHEIRVLCPFCGSITSSGRIDPKCYVNYDKDVYFCHHCNATGKATELDLTDEQIIGAKIIESRPFEVESYYELSQELSLNSEAWLKTRFPGYFLEQINDFAKIRSCRKVNAIAIPSFEGEKLIGLKYRSLDKDPALRYWSEPGSQVGKYILKTSDISKLAIVEGQFDAITLALGGFKGTILALECTSLKDELLSFVLGFSDIFLALDQDAPGQEGQAEIERKLYGKEVTKVTLPKPYKDLNEFLMAEGKAKLERFIAQNFKSRVEKLTVDLDDVIEAVYKLHDNPILVQGHTTGWNALDAYIRFRPGELVIVNSFAKAGKTTFVTNLASNLMAANLHVAMVSPEMRPAEDLIPIMALIETQFDILTSPRETVRDILGLAKKLQTNLKLFNQLGKCDFQDIKDWIRAMDKKPEILIIDHLGFLLTKPSDSDESQRLAAEISCFAREMGIVIIAVAQAPKPGRNKDGTSVRTLDEYSAFGGSAWGQYCNLYITINRMFDEEGKAHNDRLAVKAVVGRSRYNTYGHDPVVLMYDRATAKLSD